MPYEECLIPTDPQDLIEIKAQYVYSLKEAREIANNVEFIVKDIKQKYMDRNPLVIDKEVDDVMNNVLVEVLKHSFRKEIRV